jgi:2'-5' RNA ligase
MIACDIVLLPPEEIMDEAIRVNREIIDRGDDDIILDKETCIPHITLAMGCVDSSKLTEVDGILGDIASNFPELRLRTVHSQDGPASMRIQKSRDIELLHEIVLIRLSPYLKNSPESHMLAEADEARFGDETMEYIRTFATKGSFENYNPHITVGHGKTSVELGEFEFKADTLALCHLGDLCTCRKLYYSHTLMPRKER